MSEQTMTEQEHFKACVNGLRQNILNDARAVKDMKECPALNHPVPNPGVDQGEAKENLMLAYRHLEDARMRLGKAIQATEGGVSVYDKS